MNYDDLPPVDHRAHRFDPINVDAPKSGPVKYWSVCVCGKIVEGRTPSAVRADAHDHLANPAGGANTRIDALEGQVRALAAALRAVCSIHRRELGAPDAPVAHTVWDDVLEQLTAGGL